MTSAELITTALDELVDLITTAGVACTRDPGAFQPPGAIVAAPSIGGSATLSTLGLVVPVYVVTHDPGQDGLDYLLAAVTLILPVLGESSAEPTTWSSPINETGLPAYLVTVRLAVSNVSPIALGRENHAVH
jgi:hypothetical protein